MAEMFKVYYKVDPTFWIDESLTIADVLDESKFKHVRTCIADDLEEVFVQSQAENWSPMGEARELIRRLGLSHTSMSVGDVIVSELDTYYQVAGCGFKVILQGA